MFPLSGVPAVAASARRSTRSLTGKTVAGSHRLLSGKHLVLARAGEQAGFVRIQPAATERPAVKAMACLLGHRGAGKASTGHWARPRQVAAHAVAGQAPKWAPSPGPDDQQVASLASGADQYLAWFAAQQRCRGGRFWAAGGSGSAPRRQPP